MTNLKKSSGFIWGRVNFMSLLAMLCITACSGKKTVDTSSDENMKKSIEAIRKTLSKEKEEKFDAALQTVMAQNFDFSKLLQGNADSFEKDVKKSIQGKTAAEIIQTAENLTNEKHSKAKQQAMSEIDELRKKRTQAEADRKELAKFEVKRSRFYHKRNSLNMNDPMIELTLVNNTTSAVSRAYFLGTVSSPGRSIPWIKQSFNYQIPGGMEPGETNELVLSPNSFSAWGRVSTPSDAVLVVETLKLEGPNEQTIYDAEVFQSEDADRLKTLEENYPGK